jgi:mRNA interferase RelE/StbE
LAHAPRPFGREKLPGKEDLYRLRVGRYRIVYSIGDAEFFVLIVRVGDRKNVYR